MVLRALRGGQEDNGEGMKMSADVCYLCLRITAEQVKEWAGRVWPEKLAGRRAEETVHLIRRTYLRDPIFFCGRSARAVVSGIFYALAVLRGDALTQHSIADALDITIGAMRNNYKRTVEGIDIFKPQGDQRHKREKDD